MPPMGGPPPGAGDPVPNGNAPQPQPVYDPVRLLKIFEDLKKPAMEHRWIYEREWLRDIFYTINRQWIYFNSSRREWVDKRMQKWIPRPVTNKMAETLQAIRANLGAINLGVVARPVGHDPKSVSAAEIADQMAPLIHDEHSMDMVMREADFWFIVTGNAVLQVSWDRDSRFNRSFIPHEMCTTCSQVLTPNVIVAAGQKCPKCGGQNFVKAVGPGGSPIGEWIAYGRGKTHALSPFEYAFPPNVTRFDELPYIIRMRWRDKGYYEANLPQYMGRLSFEKSPADRSLQIYKSLALTNDVGTGSNFNYLGSAGGSDTVEGITEYELWLRPTPEFPTGLLMRVAGEKNPVLIEDPTEGIPGPFPYKDIEGNPLFPFSHAPYEHIGGRLLGRSALSPLIQKQDALNQLDSLIQLIIQRMANPVWVIPENAGIEHFTGEPGLIMKWNSLAAGGQAKPERIPGENVPPSLFQVRAQLLKDIEDLAGTFDIIKGQKPAGVEAFSALQLLVERSQSRFTSAFSARGEMYRHWFGVALELERQFGPQERTWAVLGPNKGYTFRHFQNAQLQGAVSIEVEDGSNIPKTSLGQRAAIEQANNMHLLDPNDPDQKWTILSRFGLADLVPTLNIHVQAALQVQDAFERWVENPMGMTPLVVKPWFDPKIHWQERIKWLNSDRMRDLIQRFPAAEQMINIHLQQLQMMMAPPPQIDPKTGQPLPQQAPPGPGGPGSPPMPPPQAGPPAPGTGTGMMREISQPPGPKGQATQPNQKGTQGQGPS